MKKDEDDNDNDNSHTCTLTKNIIIQLDIRTKVRTKKNKLFKVRQSIDFVYFFFLDFVIFFFLHPIDFNYWLIKVFSFKNENDSKWKSIDLLGIVS